MKERKTKGITLIALVIMIIVLLILAGVAIATLTGEDGVLTKVASAKEKTERAEVIENAKLDITAMQIDKEGKLTTGDLKEVLDKQFKEVPEEITEEDIATLELTTKDEKYEIKLSEIYDGKLTEASKSKAIGELVSGKVYYADLNGDQEPEGVIFADLTAGNEGSGKWTDEDGLYTIPSNVINPKEYSVSVEGYNGDLAKFGTGDILAVSGNETGNDRFYIMALSDFTTNGPTYDWYHEAYGELDNYGDDQEAFGTGRSNTKKMIDAWNARNTLW